MALKPKQPCVECSKPTGRLHPVLQVPLCQGCQKGDKYQYISKTRALTEYGLKLRDLDALRFHEVPNPHFSTAAKMRLYLRSQVEDLVAAMKRGELAEVSDSSTSRATQIAAVRDADTDNFIELLTLSGLDPKKHMRFANWSGADFSNCDLRGFDFIGARLNGCNFTGARIVGARFDQAEIDGANLRAAKDWRAFAKGWQKPKRAVNAAKSLPFFSVFQDAPFAPEMVAIQAGKFMMGSADDDGSGFDDERPQHEVTISKPFAVGRYPVTFEEWDFAVADGGCDGYKPSASRWGRGRRPVINVSWENAQAYVKWLSAKTGKRYRLLSEAEWEYVARAGTLTRYSFGDDDSKLDQYAWYRDNSGNKTHPVGEKKPNPWGPYDIHGNVWEWCEDVWHENYNGAPDDGSAWNDGQSSSCVLRGGSWSDFPQWLRSAYRFRYVAVFHYFIVGFRLARTLTS